MIGTVASGREVVPSLCDRVSDSASLETLTAAVGGVFTFAEYDALRVKHVGFWHRARLAEQARGEVQQSHARYDHAVETTVYLAFCHQQAARGGFSRHALGVFTQLVAFYQEYARQKSTAADEEDLRRLHHEHIDAAKQLWGGLVLSRGAEAKALLESAARQFETLGSRFQLGGAKAWLANFCYEQGYRVPLFDFQHAYSLM